MRDVSLVLAFGYHQVLCDSGTRHLSKFWNAQVLAQRGLSEWSGEAGGEPLAFVGRKASAPAFRSARVE